MKESSFRRILCIRKVFQMTAISVIIVLIISIVIVITTGEEVDEECVVQNLRISQTEMKIRADWEPPLGESCNNDLFYVVIEINENVYSSGFVGALYIELPKQSCALYEFAVQTRGRSGEPLNWVNETKYSSIAGSGQIENLKINDNVLTWYPPQNSEPCNVEYIIKIEPEGFKSSTETVSATTSEINLIPCGNHLISVTTSLPDLNNWVAESVSLETKGPITKLPPLHYSTLPNENGALVRWTEQPEDNLCEIEEIEFFYILTSLKETNDFEFQHFEKSDDSFYYLTDLSTNEEYSYKSRWRLTGDHGEDSTFINFKTQFIEEPTIDHKVTAEGDALQIRWYQSYPNSFVSKHVITVSDLGPIHFLPESCHPERLTWNEIRQPYEDLVLQVSPIYPNHNYSIQIETFFGELNVYTTGWDYFEADKAKPGGIIVYDDRIDYTNGELYSVKTNIFWEFPCDANGPLDDFIIRIEGKLENPDLAAGPPCNLIEFIYKSKCEDKECSISFDGLIPFFTYNVFVRTTSSFEDSWYNEVDWVLSKLPNAYTPP